MTHIYRYQGDFFPSVTTIIHEMLPEPERLTIWKQTNRNWEKQTQKSAIIGTLVHYRILNNLSARTLERPDMKFDEIPSDAVKRIELGEIMFEELGLDIGHPRKVETFCINTEHKFAGKPDLVAPINGVYTLVDLKTSREIHETHRLQMGGYFELLDRTPEQAMLISLHPNERGNKFMRAHTHTITRGELEKLADEFIDMTKKFHATKDVRKMAKECGTEN
ncbi:MAG TPA: PD-(D/E)XK nuclease family protein [Smithellaceae bacterium]|nr:PD-(D/E)XK nuclease family protein [Smithellaceae bacterium]